MKKFVLSGFLIVITLLGKAQNLPTAESQVEFAETQIVLGIDARAKVDAEIRSLLLPENSYLKDKMERIQLYLPIIERVLEEEQVPDDLKYIAILESGINSHLISSSNAVGFWQFKNETARELNLAINSDVDERENIEASTRAAAIYFKKNNLVLKNWVSSMLAYNLGATGAASILPESWSYAKTINFDSRTHSYLIKALATRIAFEYKINRAKDLDRLLIEYPTNQVSLRDVSQKLNVDYSLVKKYNTWLKTSTIPNDKNYMVVFPARYEDEEEIYSIIDNQPKNTVTKTEQYTNNTTREPTQVVSTGAFPALTQIGRNDPNPRNPTYFTINGKKGILAKPGLQSSGLANLADLSPYRFLKYNDLTNQDLLKEGQVYYLQKKNRKAKVPYHTATEDQTLWDISQMYGIRLKNLLKLNRLNNVVKLVPGQVIHLQKKRAKNQPIKIATPIEDKKETTVPTYVKNQDPVQPVNETDRKIQEVRTEQKWVPVNSNEPVTTTRPTTTTRPAPTTSTNANSPNTYGYTANAGEHLVEAGESLSSISRKYGVSVYDLKRWNNLNSDQISFNQVLKVTGTTTSKTTSQPRVVYQENDDFGEPAVVLNSSSSTTTSYQPNLNGNSHTVSRGETLYSISKMYGTTVANLKANNGLTSNEISIGQQLIVNGTTQSTYTPTSTNATTHTVSAGESLFKISQMYGLSVQDIKNANGLTSNTISIGQQLIINGGSSQANSTNYTVLKGDTLFGISRKYNVTVSEIKAWNNLSSNEINVGQSLIINQ